MSSRDRKWLSGWAVRLPRTHVCTRTLPREHPSSWTLAQLEALPAVSVVVTGYEHIDERLMDALYGPTRRSEAPGIIFSYPGDDLRVQVLLRAATKFLSPLEADWRRVDIQPNLHFGASFSRGFSMLGSEASVVQYRSALGLGAGLV